MVDFLPINMKKSKLVTICSTNTDAFGGYYPKFNYRGQSRSEKSEVDISFPTFPTNLMYYEHYDSLSSPTTRLSFIYVGGDESGRICHDFFEYKHVQTVDFTRELHSIRAVLQVISQLQNCTEVRIYLNQDNISLSDTDLRFSPQQQFMASVRNPNVKILKIEGTGSVEESGQQRTRLHDILEYSKNCFPNLEAVRINIENSCGSYYDVVQKFCSKKQSLPKHNVYLRNGKVTCEPGNNASDFSTHNKQPIVPTLAATTSSRAMGIHKTTSYDVEPLTPVEVSKFAEVVNQEMEGSLGRLQSVVKTENGKAQVSIKEEKNYSVVSLSSDEEPIPSKKQRLQPRRPSSVTSTTSETSTVIITGNDCRLQNISIGRGSSYDEWEEDDTETSLPPLKVSTTQKIPLLPTPNTAPLLPPPPPPAIPFMIPDVDFDELKDILKNAQNQKKCSSTSPSNSDDRRVNDQELKLPVEGVDYERRPKCGSSNKKRRYQDAC